MTQGLGTFTPPASAGKASPFDPRANAGKPLIVVAREFRPDFVTQRFPTPKDVVIVDLVDLTADTVYPSVIWGAAAVVDRLKGQAPEEGEAAEKLPVMLQLVKSAGGNDYATIVPLEGAALELAAKWDAKYPTRIQDESAAHRDAQAAEAPAAPAKGGRGKAAQTSAAAPTMSDDELAKAIAALG